MGLTDWRNCKTCDRVLHTLETKMTELRDEFGVRLVQSGDKKLAKTAGVLTFPGLSFYKGGGGGAPKNFEGDMSDGEALMDFLTSEEALNLPDRIERVNSNMLERLIKEKMFMAVLFCEF